MLHLDELASIRLEVHRVGDAAGRLWMRL